MGKGVRRFFLRGSLLHIGHVLFRTVAQALQYSIAGAVQLDLSAS